MLELGTEPDPRTGTVLKLWYRDDPTFGVGKWAKRPCQHCGLELRDTLKVYLTPGGNKIFATKALVYYCYDITACQLREAFL